MCLQIKGKLKIAIKDFYTFKTLRISTAWLTKNEIQSIFFSQLYELGRTYSLNSVNKIWGNYGTHSTVYEGFHSLLLKASDNDWSIKLDFREDGNYILVLCKIPKGSRYFVGTNNDIVSNKIKIVEVLAYSNECENIPTLSDIIKEDINSWVDIRGESEYGPYPDDLHKLLLKSTKKWKINLLPSGKNFKK